MLFTEILLLGVLCTSWAATLMDTDRLLNDLLTTYNTELRPVKDQDQTVIVTIGFSLISIHDFDEKAGVISVSAGLPVSWTDETLTWDPYTYGNLSTVTISQNKIWHPNLFIADPLSKAFDVGHEKFKVKVTSTGHVRWSPGGLYRGECIPNVSKFPFDRQTCQIEVFPYGYSPNEVSISLHSSSVLLTYFRPNSEYTLTGSLARVTPFLSDIAEFKLMLKRRPMNFLISVVFPIIMLGVINPFVFILPFTSGERSSFSITVLLAFTVYMTVVSDKMPESSDPISYVSNYILSLLAISTLIVIANIFQIQIQAKNEEQEPVPKWICNFVVLLRKVERQGQVNVLEDSNMPGKVDNIDNDIMNLDRPDDTEHPPTVQRIHEEKIVRKNKMTSVLLTRNVSWNNVAKSLDKTYFIIFQLLIIISTTVLFILTAT